MKSIYEICLKRSRLRTLQEDLSTIHTFPALQKAVKDARTAEELEFLSSVVLTQVLFRSAEGALSKELFKKMERELNVGRDDRAHVLQFFLKRKELHGIREIGEFVYDELLRTNDSLEILESLRSSKQLKVNVKKEFLRVVEGIGDHRLLSYNSSSPFSHAWMIIREMFYKSYFGLLLNIIHYTLFVIIFNPIKYCLEFCLWIGKFNPNFYPVESVSFSFMSFIDYQKTTLKNRIVEHLLKTMNMDRWLTRFIKRLYIAYLSTTRKEPLVDLLYLDFQEKMVQLDSLDNFSSGRKGY